MDCSEEIRCSESASKGGQKLGTKWKRCHTEGGRKYEPKVRGRSHFVYWKQRACAIPPLLYRFRIGPYVVNHFTLRKAPEQIFVIITEEASAKFLGEGAQVCVWVGPVLARHMYRDCHLRNVKGGATCSLCGNFVAHANFRMSTAQS